MHRGSAFEVQEVSIIASLKELLHNFNYICVASSYAYVVAYTSTFALEYPLVIESFGFNSVIFSP